MHSTVFHTISISHAHHHLFFLQIFRFNFNSHPGIHLHQQRLFIVWNSSSSFCTVTTARNHPHQVTKSTPIDDRSELRSSKTITDQFTESLKKFKAVRKQSTVHKNDVQLLEPIDGYASRFQYNGFLRRSHWKYYDDNDNKRPVANGPETEQQFNYRMLKKRKFCILMGYAGGDYHGMQFQYHKDVNTIERTLFDAMVKNRWILSEHVDKLWLVHFSHGSRTDTGVSAARMNVSMFLREFTPNSISNENL